MANNYPTAGERNNWHCDSFPTWGYKRINNKIKYIISEFAAGKTSSTRNEIIYILDDSPNTLIIIIVNLEVECEDIVMMALVYLI